MIRFLFPAIAICMVASALSAQDEPSSSTPKHQLSLPDIIVEHQSNKQVIKTIEDVTSTKGDAQVARWNDSICTNVIGFDDEHAVFIQKRVDEIAKDLKVVITKRPCRATILVVATNDADGFARDLIAEKTLHLGNSREGMHYAELTELLKPRPVRWIDDAHTGGADGLGANNITSGYGGGSHIERATREDKVFVIIVVDAHRLSRITWDQLADYIALVALAHPRPTAEIQDSVLSIFTARDKGLKGPPGLTATDRAILTGLYNSNSSLDPTMQRSQIFARMKKSRDAAK